MQLFVKPPFFFFSQHIFCEDCISLWFDRERTCPMCRAKVVADPTWRDGSTATYVILFWACALLILTCRTGNSKRGQGGRLRERRVEELYPNRYVIIARNLLWRGGYQLSMNIIGMNVSGCLKGKLRFVVRRTRPPHHESRIWSFHVVVRTTVGSLRNEDDDGYEDFI